MTDAPADALAAVPAPDATPFLVIDDDEVFSGTLARALTRRGYAVQVAHNGGSALALAAKTPFAYVTLDLHLGPPPEASGTAPAESGLHLVAPLRQALPDARILVLTGYASIATAVAAVKQGADEYLAKPANVDSILTALMAGVSEEAAEAALEEPVPLSVARLEWEHIQRVLTEHGGNISATARALNMHRRTLQRKLGKRPVSR
ncbi:response regulator transcription factor [Cupriavidus sp. CER94]|uniref:response regulator transcription factor n=1 Tax=Burkholderiaceae TaxID=119060 RepID=UPI0008879E2D|nr:MULTISPECIES: response regulator transcription factor [Burkholderiaceae]KAI3592230.1 Dna binding response regulator PrrA (RegA) [Cupriavidus sp. U2]SDP73616.1 two-component system, response regulator RegA [Ralstonia sp. 25mfcol4.1]